MNPVKFLEHRVKDGLFFMLRVFLRKGKEDGQGIDGRQVTKVLFLRPDKLGDMVISLPVFEALKRRYPHIRIAVVGSPRNHVLIKDDPRIDRIHLYTKRPLADLRELLAIRRERYDCILDMVENDSATTLLLSQLASPGRPRVGLGKIKFRSYYDYNYLHEYHGGGHCIDNAVELLLPFGITVSEEERFVPPHIPPSAHARIDTFLQGLGPRRPLVAFNLSAGMPTRLWAVEKATALARMIQALPENPAVVLIVSPADYARGERVMGMLSGDVHLVPKGLNVLEISYLIRHLDVLISPDTSLIHVARSFRVPVVGLYSGAKRNFLRWHPYRQMDGAVVSDCVEHLFDITPEQVMVEVRRLLARQKGVAS